ncbi:MAG TPA: tetratricopeptide repeat protein [Polyangiaceae bacterium]|nr:tetratricopeptide repeat protein [Polyangiaceae bacterium]
MLARTLFSEGNQLVEQGAYAEALQKYESAYAAWGNPKIHLNLATTLRALGRHAEAANTYVRYLLEAQPSPERRNEVIGIVEALATQLGRLRLPRDPSVQRVAVDGRQLVLDRLDFYFVEPGSHDLILETAPPGQAQTVEHQCLELEPGEERAVRRQVLPHSELRPRLQRSPLTDAPREASRNLNPMAWDHTGSEWFALARVDIDAAGRGGVGAVGMSRALGAHARIQGGALLGARGGAWVGMEVVATTQPVRPSAGFSLPTFFVSGVRAGLAGDVTLRLSVDSRWQPFVRASAAYFPSVPPNFVAFVLLPSLGLEVKL